MSLVGPGLFSERMDAVESRSAGYPESTPYAQGWLEVGEGHSIYWEVCGRPDGKPAVVLHGGPGSGADSTWTELFNPAVYRVVLFDQRGCGRSKPTAAGTLDALNANTTRHLIADIESLRTYLAIDRWLVLGASWGSVLALAYAQTHPRSVTELVLFSVVAGTQREVDWATREWVNSSPKSGSAFRPAFRTASETAISAPPITSCCSTPIRPYTSGPRGTGATGTTGKCARLARPRLAGTRIPTSGCAPRGS